MKLFYSRNIDQAKAFCDAFPEHEITCQSFIQFELIKNLPTSKTDWIFFTSRKTVEFYLSNHSIDSSCKLACLGEATASTLNEFGYESNFIGKGNDSSSIGKQFNELAHGTILFPQSNISLKKIQKEIQNKEVVDLVVYKTISIDQMIEAHDCYVFTSPSNVSAFMVSNIIPDQAKIIAIGNTTANTLNELGFDKVSIANKPTINELINCIQAK